MSLAIIFTLVSLLAVFAFFREIKRKNALAVIFSALTIGVFGWFTVMTFIDIMAGGGAPTGH